MSNGTLVVFNFSLVVVKADIVTFIQIQEKELVERHNVWLNDELNAKVNSLIELRRTHMELEADMSSKLEDVSSSNPIF